MCVFKGFIFCYFQAEEYNRSLDELVEKWQALKDLLEARKQNLLVNERVQQFLFDAGEAESWMSEQVEI